MRSYTAAAAFVPNSLLASRRYCNYPTSITATHGTTLSDNLVEFPVPAITIAELGSETKTFDAVAPDTSILVGFGLVLVLSVIASFVWAQEVVPISRTKLALSKRDGEVKEYLDELKQGYYNSTNVDSSSDLVDKDRIQVRPNVGDGRDLERWLFTDWLNNNKSRGRGRQKEPALPILKNAKWNSGDNPVLVTAGLMMIGILLAAVTERVAN